MPNSKKSNYLEFREAMLSALAEVFDDLELSTKWLEDCGPVVRPSDVRVCEIALYNIIRIQLEDIEQDLKEGVPIASHTYTYSYDIERALKNAKERK